jgi:hypothetical protein
MCRYKCDHCGREFEEPDIVTETHGLDSPPYEEIGVCPYCKGWFEEMHKCEICGEYYTADELTSGVCDECIYQHDTDIELCHRLGEEAEETIKINGFIASVFSEEQINEILWNRIKEISRIVNVSCYDFIESDKSWLAEKLIEEKQKEIF